MGTLGPGYTRPCPLTQDLRDMSTPIRTKTFPNSHPSANIGSNLVAEKRNGGRFLSQVLCRSSAASPWWFWDVLFAGIFCCWFLRRQIRFVFWTKIRNYNGHDMKPTQTSCTMMKGIPQNYHTLVLFDPPRIGNLIHDPWTNHYFHEFSLALGFCCENPSALFLDFPYQDTSRRISVHALVT